MGMCFVPDCKHYSERDRCKFFRFPLDQNLKKIWIKNIRRGDRSPSKYSKVCSCHFKDGDKKEMPTIFSRNKDKIFLFGSPEVKQEKFPANKERRKKWVQAVKRQDWKPGQHSFLCSEHFTEDQIDRTSLFSTRLTKDAVPQIFKSFPSYYQNESNNKCKDFSQIEIKSENMLSTTCSSEDTFSATVTSNEALLTTMKSKDNFSNANDLGSVQENILQESRAEPVQSTCIDSISEQINCVTHTEAFYAAKTILHYMISQDDVNTADINFILNLIKKIESKLSIKKK